MKKWIIVLVTLALLAGFAQADRGIDPTPETQGIGTMTTISAVGTFQSRSDLSISSTDDLKGLNGIPPLEYSGDDGEITIIIDGEEDMDGLTALGQVDGAAVYNAIYTEDTLSNGQGVIQYTKILDVDTSAKTTGQSNIEAFKQISYSGGNTGNVLSDETIAVDGIAKADPMFRFGLGILTPAPDPASGCTRSICGLSCPGTPVIPAFCNSAEAGSSVDMSQVHLTTTSSARFIMTSIDSPVVLSHDIRVIDSIGKARAGIDVMSMESRPVEDIFRFSLNIDQQPFIDIWFTMSSENLYQTTSFSESTQVDGIITTFDKNMVYESGMRR